MLLLIPVLLLVFAMMIIHAPRVFATAYDSFGVRWDKVTGAFDKGDVGSGLGNLLQCSALVLPALGMVVSSGRVGKRVGAGALGWSAGSPVRRSLVVGGTIAAAALAAYTWWPNGDYRPIQQGERGTIQAGLESFTSVPSGRPSLTPQRQQQLQGAPFQRKKADPTPSKQDRKTTDNASTKSEETSTTEVPSTTTETTPTETDTTPAETPTTTAPATTTTDTSTSATPTDTTTSTTPTDTTTTPTTTTPTTTTP